MHDLTTRTVNMSRDQQIDHGFGICVKGGKDSGELFKRIFIYEGCLYVRSKSRFYLETKGITNFLILSLSTSVLHN